MAQYQSYLMEHDHAWLPTYSIVKAEGWQGHRYRVIAANEHEQVPEAFREDFQKDGEVNASHGKHKNVFLTTAKASKAALADKSLVSVSKAASDCDDYVGCITDFLSSVYKFNRKSERGVPPHISVDEEAPKVHKVVSLVEARNQCRDWANGRGDVEGNPTTYKRICEDFAKTHGLEITVYEGDELLKQGFRLAHAVGRASVNPPCFVNMGYRGNPDSKDWIAFVGKGVCFDAGGLNMKTTAGIGDMFLDKSGAMTVLAAFFAIVKEKLPINVTCSIGLVENFISANSYRPNDIIKSRKGLTVQIGNTDAEGRLVLADAMHWTQEHYKPHTLIELSTLTGAIIFALGHQLAGFFTNDRKLFKSMRNVGERVHEPLWHMPCTDYHKDLVTPKAADLTNSPGKPEAGSAQAAAFLKHFVEEGVSWAHIDIAGVGMVGGANTGWGSRLLVEYVRGLALTE